MVGLGVGSSSTQVGYSIPPSDWSHPAHWRCLRTGVREERRGSAVLRLRHESGGQAHCRREARRQILDGVSEAISPAVGEAVPPQVADDACGAERDRIRCAGHDAQRARVGWTTCLCLSGAAWTSVLAGGVVARHRAVLRGELSLDLCLAGPPPPLRVVASFGLALTRIRTAHSAHAFPHTAMSASCAVNAPLADPPGVSGRALGREPLARVCGCMLPGGAGLGALGGAARAQKGQRRTPALRGCLWRMFP